MASLNVHNESTRDSEDWYDDIGQNLDTFVRLSKAGHFRRANQYYHDVLERYADQIAVVASYADSLIDQGAFREAESLLLASLKQYRGPAHGGDDDIEAIDILDHEACVLSLLLSLACLYTRCDWKQACVLVERVQNTSKILHIDFEMPPLQLQIAVLSLRLTDLLLRISCYAPTWPIKVKLKNPFRANATSSSRSSWAETPESIVALLKHDYLWEAQTLYMMILRYPALQTRIPFARIIHSIPEEDDSMYTLVSLTMLASSSRYSIGTYGGWRDIMCQDVTRLTRPIEGVGISIADSRAFALALLVCLTLSYLGPDERDELATLLLAVESKWLPGDSHSWTQDTRIAGIQKMRTMAAEHDDYMFSLVACEVSGLALPKGWLEKTGASRLAILYLHPKAILEEIDDGSVPLLGKVAAGQDSLVAEAARSSIQPRADTSILPYALSIPGLFLTCVQHFNLVRLGREFTNDFGSCLLQLRATEVRLHRWGRAANITDESSDAFVKQLQNNYTLQEVQLAYTACARIEEQLFIAMADSQRILAYVNLHSEWPDDIDDELRRTEICAPDASCASRALKSVRSGYERSLQFTSKVAVPGKWTVYTKKDLTNLLAAIGEHIATLETLFPQQERDLAAQEAASMEPDAIKVLASITAISDPLLAEALEAAAPQHGLSWNEIVSAGYATIQLGNKFEDPHANTDGISRWDDMATGLE